MKLSVQENLVPGKNLVEKWHVARDAGYDALELRGKGGMTFARRRAEFDAALKAGADLATVCPEMPHFIGAFDPDLRADALENLKLMLSVIADLGGRGVMTPASWGMHSNRLPIYPQPPPRTPEEDRHVLIDAFQKLGQHALQRGVEIYLEPLNRYEDHMVNTIGSAAAICCDAGLPSVRIVGDSYHMNIEEDRPSDSILEFGKLIGHMQMMDSNRLEPGAGHLDFVEYVGALSKAGYDGYLALECRLREPAEIALPKAAEVLREAIRIGVGHNTPSLTLGSSIPG